MFHKEYSKDRLHSLLLLTIFVLFVNGAPPPSPYDNEEDVVFEKILDQNPQQEKEVECMEVVDRHNGGQCMDLLAALHSLLIDDLGMIGKSDGQGAHIRVRREVIGQLESNLTMGMNGSVDGLSDFPLPDEESVFAQIMPQNGNGTFEGTEWPNVTESVTSSRPTSIPTTPETSSSNHSTSIPTTPETSTSNYSTENLSTTEQGNVEEALLWEIATAIAHLNRGNGSGDGDDQGALDRIGHLLTKLLPILVHMKDSIRKVGFDIVNGSLVEVKANSTGHDSGEPSIPQWSISVNASGPLTIDHKDSRSSESAEFNISKPIIEPPVLPEPSVRPPSITDRPTTNNQIETDPKKAISDVLKEKLVQRAPHFVPREKTIWWKAEKRRQQACVLLSSFDVIRQKCCLTLPLICPEYSQAIEARKERLVDGNVDVAVFERNGGKGRGRRDGISMDDRNSMIADTLARISNLLSVLIRSDDG